METPAQLDESSVKVVELGSKEGAFALGTMETVLNLSSPSNLGTMHILVVEDDAVQRQVLGVLFQKANEKNQNAIMFEVTYCGCGNEAIALLAAPDTPNFHLIRCPIL